MSARTLSIKTDEKERQIRERRVRHAFSRTPKGLMAARKGRHPFTVKSTRYGKVAKKAR